MKKALKINLKKIKNYTIEKMAERHFEILNIIQNR